MINNRPSAESGLAKLCRLKSDIKKAEKVSMIAQGVELAEMKKNFLQGG